MTQRAEVGPRQERDQKVDFGLKKENHVIRLSGLGNSQL